MNVSTNWTRREFGAAVAALPAFTAAPRPNILFLICDQLNPAVISPYGGPVATPNIERIAHRGTLFTNATCPTPFCSPSRASIVTGLYPSTHGVVHNLSRVDYPAIASPVTEEGLRATDVTTDGVLHAAGYSTHQYGKWHLSGDALPYYSDPYGEHREYAREMRPFFEEVRKRPRQEWMDWYGWSLPVTVAPPYAHSFGEDDPVRKLGLRDFILKFGKLGMRAEDIFDVRVAQKAIERIRSVKGPFSVTCSFNWPHDPNVIHTPYYEAVDPAGIELPATLQTREARFEKDLSRQMVAGNPEVRLREFLRVYYASVKFIDDQVGRVLDALDASPHAANTIVVFTSDHGDMAGGHGMAWKSTQAFYDEIARVPLIIALPGSRQSGRSAAECSLVDLAPTLLDSCGLPPPTSMEGVSLMPVLTGGSSARDRYLYRRSERVRPNAAHTRALASQRPADRMLRGNGWKYCRYADGEEFLYHLERDPRETRNLAAEQSAKAMRNEMRSRL